MRPQLLPNIVFAGGSGGDGIRDQQRFEQLRECLLMLQPGGSDACG